MTILKSGSFDDLSLKQEDNISSLINNWSNFQLWPFVMWADTYIDTDLHYKVSLFTRNPNFPHGWNTLIFFIPGDLPGLTKRN